MHKDMTPEERLLRHIRQKSDNAQEGTVAGAVRGLASSILFAKNTLMTRPVLTRALVAVSLVLAGYVGYEAMAVSRRVEDITTVAPAASPDDELQQVAFAEPKPFEYYAQKIQSRDIFESPLYQDKAKSSDTISSAPELTKSLRLVGIVIDDGAEAIIEDTEINQTFFLRIGDRIRNAVVEDIKEGKVILSYNDQQVELTQ